MSNSLMASTSSTTTNKSSSSNKESSSLNIMSNESLILNAVLFTFIVLLSLTVIIGIVCLYQRNLKFRVIQDSGPTKQSSFKRFKRENQDDMNHDKYYGPDSEPFELKMDHIYETKGSTQRLQNYNNLNSRNSNILQSANQHQMINSLKTSSKFDLEYSNDSDQESSSSKIEHQDLNMLQNLTQNSQPQKPPKPKLTKDEFKMRIKSAKLHSKSHSFVQPSAQTYLSASPASYKNFLPKEVILTQEQKQFSRQYKTYANLIDVVMTPRPTHGYNDYDLESQETYENSRRGAPSDDNQVLNEDDDAKLNIINRNFGTEEMEYREPDFDSNRQLKEEGNIQQPQIERIKTQNKVKIDPMSRNISKKIRPNYAQASKSKAKQQQNTKPSDLQDIFGNGTEQNEKHNENNGTQGNLIGNIFYTNQLTGSSLEDENVNLQEIITSNKKAQSKFGINLKGAKTKKKKKKKLGVYQHNFL
ncbi:UNKNOWN [Stylonychia lemnae]|uniref:Transmembrane protein n=1 Tax=Stylonychia lemnae TaxID=5949 RepID=A0A077ZWR2_STYLE|nr:UNKNOWN [Stylonychia lemnae]|eukprot:CDW74330.1 UNKNOWN [Stylonychia lemnae]